MGIEWSDELSMLNADIDAEHKRLIELVNEMNREIASQQRSQNEISRIMRLMLNHSVEHFAHEEQLFAEHDYPDAVEHTENHSELIGKLNEALKAIQNTDHVRRWVEIGQAVEDLLVDHVLNEDTKYIECLRTE